MLPRRVNGGARKGLLSILSRPPHFILVEIVGAQRVAGLTGRKHHPAVIPLPDIDNLAPGRDFPDRKRT